MARIALAARTTPLQRRRRLLLLVLAGLGVALIVYGLGGSGYGGGAAATTAAASSSSVVSAAAVASSAAEDKPAAAATAAAASASSSSSDVHTGVFFTIAGEGGQPDRQQELLNEPLPADCYPEESADYDGSGVTWGLTFKRPSAAQCCQTCKEATVEAHGKRANVWVFCPSPTGLCWSQDIWNHTTGECWCKVQADWDGNTDLKASNLKANNRGAYPAAFRQEHKTSPGAHDGLCL